MCTVQAPQSAMPHPSLVPVMCNLSRSTQSRGVLGSISNLRFLPLIVSEIMGNSFAINSVGKQRLHLAALIGGSCFRWNDDQFKNILNNY
jgi:hypothetical protein